MTSILYDSAEELLTESFQALSSMNDHLPILPTNLILVLFEMAQVSHLFLGAKRICELQGSEVVGDTVTNYYLVLQEGMSDTLGFFEEDCSVFYLKLVCGNT